MAAQVGSAPGFGMQGTPAGGGGGVPGVGIPGVSSAGGQGAAGPRKPVSLYVANLAPETTQAKLDELFRSFGRLQSVRIIYDAVDSNKSLGYGYVNFIEHADAKTALRDLSGTMLDGRPIRVAWVQRDPTLRRSGRGNVFIKGIPPKWGTSDLFDFVDTQLMAADGKSHIEDSILSCRIALNVDGSSKGYGYVQFDSMAHAERAIAQFHGLRVDGHSQPLDLQHYRRREERRQEDASSWTNVIIFGLPAQWGDKALGAMVRACGFEPQNVKVQQDADGRSRSFGYANMRTNADAVGLVAKVTGSVWTEDVTKVRDAPPAEDDEELEVLEQSGAEPGAASGSGSGGDKARSKKGKVTAGPAEDGSGFVLEARRHLTRAEVARLKEESRRQRKAARAKSNSNLFVRQLDEGVTEEDLREAFGQFGLITSAKVVRDDETGVSRGFGYVAFSKEEEAQEALRMDRTVLKGKPIRVTIHMSKEMRARQLADKRRRQAQRQSVMGAGGLGMGGAGAGGGMMGGMMGMMGMMGMNPMVMQRAGQLAQQIASEQQRAKGSPLSQQEEMQVLGMAQMAAQREFFAQFQQFQQQQMALAQQQAAAAAATGSSSGGSGGSSLQAAIPPAAAPASAGSGAGSAGPATGQQMPSSAAAPAPSGAAAFLSSIRNLGPKDQQQAIGTQLYRQLQAMPYARRRINGVQDLESTITGMLLAGYQEGDLSALVGLLDDPATLRAQAEEAVRMLVNAHGEVGSQVGAAVGPDGQ